MAMAHGRCMCHLHVCFALVIQSQINESKSVGVHTYLSELVRVDQHSRASPWRDISGLCLCPDRVVGQLRGHARVIFAKETDSIRIRLWSTCSYAPQLDAATSRFWPHTNLIKLEDKKLYLSTLHRNKWVLVMFIDHYSCSIARGQ